MLQEWIQVVKKLTDEWSPTTADFLKGSVWIFRRNVTRLIRGKINRKASPLVEKNMMAERVHSYAQECLSSQSPLLAILSKNMNFNGIDQWLSIFRK